MPLCASGSEARVIVPPRSWRDPSLGRSTTLGIFHREGLSIVTSLASRTIRNPALQAAPLAAEKILCLQPCRSLNDIAGSSHQILGLGAPRVGYRGTRASSRSALRAPGCPSAGLRPARCANERVRFRSNACSRRLRGAVRAVSAKECAEGGGVARGAVSQALPC